MCTRVFLTFVCRCCEQVSRSCGRREDVVYLLFLILFGNAGLLLIDHIHFQYNGFLYGIMFLSIARLLQRREVEAAFWFSVLLNLKHIYLYVAPVYFIYLLRSYCLSSTVEGHVQWHSLSVFRLVKLGATVGAVFALSFGPFIMKVQLSQVLSRLFPFKRGLSHAYWAPNFWALYNFADKVLEYFGTKLGWVSLTGRAAMTGGLVQEFDHAVLPSISPLVTFVATALSIMVCAVLLHAVCTTYILHSHWLEGRMSPLFLRIPLCNLGETVYLLGLIPLFFYQQLGHDMLDRERKMPFLPLMLISVYCSVGVMYSWLKYYNFVLNPRKGKKKSH
nr:probable dolichyl pyrophosphate Glc1Man9GlcNAc2 alpha-1,3-glucosyltransferase [Cherax quadricarinatus]